MRGGAFSETSVPGSSDKISSRAGPSRPNLLYHVIDLNGSDSRGVSCLTLLGTGPTQLLLWAFSVRDQIDPCVAVAIRFVRYISYSNACENVTLEACMWLEWMPVLTRGGPSELPLRVVYPHFREIVHVASKANLNPKG